MKDSVQKNNRQPQTLFIIISLIFGLAWALMPLPEAVRPYKPDLLSLIIFYWVLVLPKHFGVVFGWFNGLLLDFLSFALLGQNALARGACAYLATLNRTRFRFCGKAEQCVIVGTAQLISAFIVLWVQSTVSQEAIAWNYLLTAVTTGALWPLVSWFLDQTDPAISRG